MTETTGIKVMIVDDHPLIRDGLRSTVLAADDMTLVGEAANGQTAVALCRDKMPDVILMDISMPKMNGIEATRAILSQNPDGKIVILTTFAVERMIRDALEAGAISFLLKDTPGDRVIEAIRSAYAGQSTLAQEATRSLIGIRAGGHKLGEDLTPREKETLALMIKGLTNDEIAERLVVSLGTVRNHVSACISKLEAANRTHAVALAVEHQLTP
jgi:NarL family two-component system response regulator LiaR